MTGLFQEQRQKRCLELLTYLVKILDNKTIIIGNPYTNFTSIDLSHYDRPEHMDSIFISLLFLPKSWILPKTAIKP
jgi:hypothetical protein